MFGSDVSPQGCSAAPDIAAKGIPIVLLFKVIGAWQKTKGPQRCVASVAVPMWWTMDSPAR